MAGKQRRKIAREGWKVFTPAFKTNLQPSRKECTKKMTFLTGCRVDCDFFFSKASFRRGIWVRESAEALSQMIAPHLTQLKPVWKEEKKNNLYRNKKRSLAFLTFNVGSLPLKRWEHATSSKHLNNNADSPA